ncbi:MAG: ATP synthase F1 subunit gamma, partial [Chloroflexi bacterium]|nr:ATP synthase F1 subunit gamma [Chloroflexota bacterium]
LMERPPVRRVLVVHIPPDRGLCGGLPGNMNRATGQFVLRQEAHVSVITVGKKGRDFMVRTGRDVKAVFTDLGDRPSLADTMPIIHMVEESYTSGEVDQVFVAYPEYVSVLVQRPVISQVLPVEPPEGGTAEAGAGYIYEPSDRAVYAALVPRFLQMQVYHAVLESIASEQSARMVAMRNATDNASDMAEGLTLQLNKVRQEGITRELLDIIGGVAALSQA